MTFRVRALVLVLLFAAVGSSCGQQGPLVLPEGARPIDPVAPSASETEQSDDEPADER